ncbi:MAG: TauD/TfdA family dioxygenase [Betaproteobacteria bacterium]|nr:TauD/TfdA family dioxygenase [Betaproteobacteria bacterium]
MGTMAEQQVTARPLCAHVGAEMLGARIADLDDGGFAVVREAFFRHTMLIFRDQFLGPDAQLAFTRRWGGVYITPYVKKLEGYPEVLAVVNWGKDKTVTEAWHSDASFLAEPPGIAILAAQVLPSAGGDTMFANTYAAYDALSERMKQLLEGLRCINVDTVLAKFAGVVDPNLKPHSHPVVRTHPVTKRKCLYVNPLFSMHFDGMTADESRGLLQYLFEHCSRYEFVYRHQWRAGDVVMWDNRCSMHYAVHDYGVEQRLLHRTTVDGSGRPV